MKQRGEQWSEEIRDFAGLRSARHRLCESMRQAGAPPLQVGDAELVLTELGANSLRYGSGRVDVHFEWAGDAPVIHVWDFGCAFDVRTERPSSSSEEGRGLFLVHAIARRFTVERSDDRNHACAQLQPLPAAG